MSLSLLVGATVGKHFEYKSEKFSYPSVLTYVLCSQKNCLIETLLLSTNNTCFGPELKKKNYFIVPVWISCTFQMKSFYNLIKQLERQ